MQLFTINEPLLPNLTALNWSGTEGSLIPFLPLFLSPGITSICFESFVLSVPEFVVASVITNLPTPCPNLRDIHLRFLPRGLMITAAVSRMVLATNRNALRKFHVDSSLTKKASAVIYRSQNLRSLSIVIEGGTLIPSASLPNLISLQIECEDWSGVVQLFRRATFGKLKSVKFHIESRSIGDFLEAFKGAALSSSVQNTLSVIRLTADWSWKPNYSSLLPFTLLVDLEIRFPCGDNCSGLDDHIIVHLSQAMPKLESLKLGDWPCRGFTGGVTTKGFMALARNCPNISSLRVHFQVVSLNNPPIDLGTTDNSGCSASWTGGALRVLQVGEIPVPEGAAPTIALTLLRIFPQIESIILDDEGWCEVEDIIHRSKRTIDYSSRCHHPTVPRNSLLTLLRSQTHDQQLERGR